MIYTIAGGLAEMIFLNTPIMLVEYSAKGTYWIGRKIYRHYYPPVRENDLLRRDISKLKFEIDQLKDNKWVLINKK